MGRADTSAETCRDNRQSRCRSFTTPCPASSLATAIPFSVRVMSLSVTRPRSLNRRMARLKDERAALAFFRSVDPSSTRGKPLFQTTPFPHRQLEIVAENLNTQEMDLSGSGQDPRADLFLRW